MACTNCEGAAKYNRRITIQKPVYTDTPSGGAIPDWEDVRVCWARIKPTTGGERFQAHQVWPSAMSKIAIRYVWGLVIDASMRIVYGTHIYNIKHVADTDEAHKEIVMLCEEPQAKGTKR